MAGTTRNEPELELPMSQVVQVRLRVALETFRLLSRLGSGALAAITTSQLGEQTDGRSVFVMSSAAQICGTTTTSTAAVSFQTHIIPNEESIDPDVFRHMNSLGCFKDKQKLIDELLSTRYVLCSGITARQPLMAVSRFSRRKQRSAASGALPLPCSSGDNTSCS